MVKNKTAEIRKWHNFEIVGAIVGIILILSFISVLSATNFSQASSTLPTYYVSSIYGNDSFSGFSKDEPFKTVEGVTKFLTSADPHSRSARIIILGEYTGRIDLNGLGIITLEGATGNKITGSVTPPNSGAALISIQNTDQVELKGLNIDPADSTRPIIDVQVKSEAPTIVKVASNSIVGSQGIRLINSNEGLSSGSLKVHLSNNIFYVEKGVKPFLQDVANITPRSKDLSVKIEVLNNLFQSSERAFLPLIELDELPGFVTIKDNSFMAQGELLLEGLTKFSQKIILENDLLQDNKFGQVQI